MDNMNILCGDNSKYCLRFLLDRKTEVLWDKTGRGDYIFNSLCCIVKYGIICIELVFYKWGYYY